MPSRYRSTKIQKKFKEIRVFVTPFCDDFEGAGIAVRVSSNRHGMVCCRGLHGLLLVAMCTDFSLF